MTKGNISYFELNNCTEEEEMVIGPGPDYYNGNNQKENEDVKLNDIIYAWWESLTEEEQFEIMLRWYPNAVTKDTDIDKLFGDMALEYKYEVYEKECKGGNYD